MPINQKPTLTKNQRILIDLLGSSPLRQKFYWTGGTLLAHHFLHHRNSLDMDFFSENKFSYDELIPFIQKIKEKTGITKIEEFKIYDRWEFILKNSEITRFEFVYYNHDRKRLRSLEKLYGIFVDSLEDMAANKLMAFFDRNEPKDLFDIYFLLKKKFSLKKLLSLAEEKVSVKFSEFMFWSECTKSLASLNQLKPLLFEKNPEKQNLLFQKITDYFNIQGQKYLEARLK